MSYLKTILCLAASRKPGGRCFAGKEIIKNGVGEWIRPVSDKDTEAISNQDSRYKTGQTAQLLDVIRIPMLNPKPHAYQTENHLIDAEKYWGKIKTATWSDVEAALDNINGTLWINGFSSPNHSNDRVPDTEAKSLISSLCLIRPQDFRLSVETNHWDNKKKVRAIFSFNDHDYDLRVTDPDVEPTYKAKGDGMNPLKDVILCVSLGEPFKGFAYKLAAAVIEP